MADDVEMTPITEAEASVPPKVAPFGAAAAPAPAAPAPAPAAAPAATTTAKTGVTTLKLKPVIRKPMIRKPEPGGAKPAAPAAPAAAVAKKTTQNLKSVTGPIPVQATLKKTGIVAEGIITPAQQQAAKSKTSRISLESAIGVAPVKEAVAPIKTIRLRRPTDLKPQPLGAAPAEAPAAPASAPAAPAAAPAADQGVTQKKTLKLHRPSGAGIKRPTMGIASASPAPAAEGDVANIPDMAPVSDIPDLAAMSGAAAKSSDVPGWVKTLSLITTIAALVTVGVLAYYLYLEGCGSVVGANEMPFLQI